jgi:hypothetical protein
MRGRHLIAVLGLWVCCEATAGIVEFHDKVDWIAAAGSFTTIGFNEYPAGTFITDQWADLGVVFTDGSDTTVGVDPITYPEDGWGLDGNGNIVLEFAEPMSWIASDFPGFLRFHLYADGQIFYSSGLFGVGGVGNFGGLVSDQSFDMAVLMDITVGFEAEIDSLHFGRPVPGPGAIGILAVAALRSRRRRVEELGRTSVNWG